MRVLHVVGRLGMGGDSVVILSVKKHLQEQGITFDFLTHKGCHDKTVQQVKSTGSKVWIFPGDVWHMGGIGYFFGVLRLLHKNHYEAVHFHTSLQSGIGLLAARLSHVPIRICYAHAANIQRKVHPAIKMLLAPILRKLISSNATVCAACGKDAGTFLFGKKPYCLIPNGISPSLYLPSAEMSLRAQQLKEKLHIPPNAVVLGQVGRLDWMKNAFYSLRTAFFLAEKMETVLLYIGEGREQKELEETAEIFCAKRENLKVIFLGRQKREELSVYYHIFDFLLIPSKTGEGLPLTLLEAQAAGCHVLASDLIPKEGDIGLELVQFLPVSQPTLWAEKILYQNIPPPPDVPHIEEKFNESGRCENIMAERWIKLYFCAK
jgi:glycosyltransferase EpsF